MSEEIFSQDEVFSGANGAADPFQVDEKIADGANIDADETAADALEETAATGNGENAEDAAPADEAAQGEEAASESGAAEDSGASEEDETPGVVTEEEVRRRLRGLDGKWYVLHTYSGYEKRVKQDLEARIVTMNMEDYIFQIEVPMEEVFEIRRGQRKLVSRVRMPGYVLIRMELTNDSWRVVQATNGVTGFVGNGREPVALTFDEVVRTLTPVVEAEVAAQARAAGLPTGATPEVVSPFEVGDAVTLTAEPWAGMPATVSDVDPANQRLTVMMTLVGQETPVELSFDQVRKED